MGAGPTTTLKAPGAYISFRPKFSLSWSSAAGRREERAEPTGVQLQQQERVAKHGQLALGLPSAPPGSPVGPGRAGRVPLW